MPVPKNCPHCGKLYLEVGHKMCLDCFTVEQEMEQRVMEYVRENRQVNVKDIVDNTGVKERLVIKMIREGRFMQSEYPVAFPCESCGEPIFHGKVCRKCSEKFMDEVAKLNAANAQPQNANRHSMAMMRDSDKRK